MNRAVILRKAEEQDCHDLYVWRNDKETQRNSKTTNIVSWENHCRWLAAVLADPERALYVGFDGDAKIGTVRLDHMREGHCVVSITLNPKYRGIGYSKLLLELALRRTNARVVEATIRDENEKSRRLFASCGFAKVDQDGGNGFSVYRKVVSPGG